MGPKIFESSCLEPINDCAKFEPFRKGLSSRSLDVERFFSGFRLFKVTENDIILAESYYKSSANGKDGIP